VLKLDPQANRFGQGRRSGPSQAPTRLLGVGEELGGGATPGGGALVAMGSWDILHFFPIPITDSAVGLVPALLEQRTTL